MNPGMLQLIIILIYLACLLALGVGASRFFRGTKKDYLLASHSIGPFLLLMSLFGTTMTAFALVGSTGEAYKEGIGVYGLLASSSGIVHSLCFFVVGVKLWSLGKRNGYSTQIEFFRDRFNNDHLGLLLFPILVGLVIPYLLIGVISSGTLVQNLTAGAFPDLFPTDSPATNGGVAPWLGSLGICAVVLIYVFFGGMRGTAWANTMQTIVFMVLGVVTFVIIAMKLGNQPSLLASMQELSDSVSSDKMTRSEMSKTKFLTYMLVPLSVGMFPHLFQHWLTAKSAAAFKVPVVCQPIFIMIVWVPCVLIGVWATTDLVPTTPPLPDNPNAILPFLVSTQTTALLGGLLAAGILAAIMSSLDSQFLCLGTIFSNDIVAHYMGPKRFSDRGSVWLARGFIIAIVAATYFLSLLGPRSVFAMGVWCFSGYAGLFPLIFASLYWRRTTLLGVVACVVVSMSVWGYFFWDAKLGADRTYTVDIVVVDRSAKEAVADRKAELLALSDEEQIAIAAEAELGPPPMLESMVGHRLRSKILDHEFEGQITRYKTMAVLWVFLAALVSLIVVSLVTPPPPEKVLVRFFPAGK